MNYKQLYETIIEGFLLQGYEIYEKSSWICSLRRWKLVHKTEDIKVVETIISIALDDEIEPTKVLIHYEYNTKE